METITSTTCIGIAATASDLHQCYGVLAQLHPHLSEPSFIESFQRQQNNGYKLAYLKANGIVKSVAGFHIGESFAWQKYLYIDDFVTDASCRSQGYGQTLLNWLKEYAKENHCVQLHLDSRVTRYATHKFYLNQGLIIGGYHFLTELSETF